MASSINLLTATASELQAELCNGSITSKQLVKLYLDQISKYNGYLKAVTAVVQEDILTRRAEALDNKRAQGMTHGPLHGMANAGGSSAGSAVAVAAGFSPPTRKIVPTIGIVSPGAGPDYAGPMAKTVLDLANLLDVMVDQTKTRMMLEGGYRSAVTGKWGEIRIGVLDPDEWLSQSPAKYEKEASNQMVREWKAAYKKLATVAEAVEPVTLVSVDESIEQSKRDRTELDATFPRLKVRLDRYVALVDDAEFRVCTVDDIGKFSREHAVEEQPPGADRQASIIRVVQTLMTDQDHEDVQTFTRNQRKTQGINRVLEENKVNVIMKPRDGPLFRISGTEEYPEASLPLGYLDCNGKPFGLQIMAKAHQEALLIQVQSA
ncbi:amidase signature domain-containing protein [Podospora aff. communis PSN243]|uniref:Amidase signature domain-containing protein n=1 Tax=Podospora aff. communis PSN243 TaxID=3040156 RepID=A0AAV9G7V4_9PEZI|nr:amidase signature domain-containing protein [Podospora aff. communis PSN243]